MPSNDVDRMENQDPGFTVQRIASRSSGINGRLRKRYGNGKYGNGLPLGQLAPALLSAGTSPPVALLTGRPTLGSMQIGIIITTPGALGAAVCKFTLDGAVTYTAGVTVNSSVALNSASMQSGLTAQFPVGNYGSDNQYAAATPVPEIVLDWLTVQVTADLYAKRGANPEDPQMQWLREDLTRVYEEIKEAADSKDGLFDLPTSEDLDSAVTTGGPLGCSDGSPYAWQDRQARRGGAQDARQYGGPGGFAWGIWGGQ
jgi:hypothetical protein